MTQFNPYAAPETDSLAPVIAETLGGGAWRDRKTLVMLKTAELPRIGRSTALSQAFDR